MSWDDIVGHEDVIRRLRSAISASRLHPALLFEGPEGIGKRLVAMTLAQGHHCPHAPSRGGDPCGVCSICRAISASGGSEIVQDNQSLHPGIRVVSLSRADEREVRFGSGSGRGDVRSQITVPQIRVMLSEATAASVHAARFVIIDPADRMGDSAANALLKTLEEPPSGQQFVLITQKPSALLPTIRSRCVRFRFGLLSPSDVERALERAGIGHAASSARHAPSSARESSPPGARPPSPKRGGTKGPGGAGDATAASPSSVSTSTELPLIASLSAGRVGHALRLSEGNALARFKETRALMLESLQALARGLPPGTFSIVAGELFRGREREEWHETIGVLESLLRDLAVLSVDPGAEVVNIDLHDTLVSLAAALGERSAKALPVLDAVRSDMRLNVNGRLAAERILIEVAG